MVFTIMWGYEPKTEVHISDDMKECSIINLSDKFLPFMGGKIDMLRVYNFMKSRCLDDNRVGLKDILAEVGLKDNNPWEWCRKTHGVMWEDMWWIKYEDEDITYDDVRLR